MIKYEKKYINFQIHLNFAQFIWDFNGYLLKALMIKIIDFRHLKRLLAYKFIKLIYSIFVELRNKKINMRLIVTLMIISTVLLFLHSDVVSGSFLINELKKQAKEIYNIWNNLTISKQDQMKEDRSKKFYFSIE